MTGSLLAFSFSSYSIVNSIFALSLTRFAFCNPNGITYGYATFDLLLQNSSITKQKSIGSFIVTLMNSPITKRCFVIPTEHKRRGISKTEGKRFFRAKPSIPRSGGKCSVGVCPPGAAFYSFFPPKMEKCTYLLGFFFRSSRSNVAASHVLFSLM